MRKATTAIQIGSLLCAASAMVSVWLYCVWNPSGHSAVDLRWISAPFLIVVFIGFMTMQFPEDRRLALTLSILGICGAGLGWFIHGSGVMVPYEVWVNAGMPDPNPRSTEFVAGYVLASLLLAVLLPHVLQISRSKESSSKR